MTSLARLAKENRVSNKEVKAKMATKLQRAKDIQRQRTLAIKMDTELTKLEQITAKEEAKQAKIVAKEEAKEEAKQAKITAKEEAKQAKIVAKEEAKQAKIVAKQTKVDQLVEIEMAEDTYTKELLQQQYALHKSYVTGRIDTTKKIGVTVRLPGIPEDISENIVKQIIHNKLNDKTSRWDCKKGDLESQQEGKQECKCFTSNGPPSFTPSSDWDVIYFLDARNWLNNIFVLFRVSLKRTSTEWRKIKVKKTQTFEDQTKQGRRPRITWVSLYPQIEPYCSKVYEGTFEDIFIPLVKVE